MSARSFIAIRNPKGDYTGIYCHWDGYFAHNGRVLLDCYGTKRLARALVRLGDISSLGRHVAPYGPHASAHSYDNRQEGVTVSYHRDRGESWDSVKPKSFDTIRDMARYADNSWCEYIYIFDGKRWHGNRVDLILADFPFETLTQENTSRESES